MNRPTDHVSKAVPYKPIAGNREMLSGRQTMPQTKLEALPMLLLHDRVSVNKMHLLWLLSLNRKVTTHPEKIRQRKVQDHNFKTIALYIWLTVGLNNLKCLFQHKWSYDLTATKLFPKPICSVNSEDVQKRDQHQRLLPKSGKARSNSLNLVFLDGTWQINCPKRLLVEMQVILLSVAGPGQMRNPWSTKPPTPWPPACHHTGAGAPGAGSDMAPTFLSTLA